MFPPTSQPGSQVTGTEEDEFQNFLKAEIKKGIEAAGAANGQAPQPIPVNFAGQQLSFKDPGELNTWLNDYNNRVATMMNEKTTAPPPAAAAPTQGSHVTGDDSQDFTLDSFVDKLAKNPSSAIMDAIRHEGIDLKALKAMMDQQALHQDEQAQHLAAARFKDAFPDFPASPQAGNIMQGLLTKFKQPFTFEGLAAAYALGDKIGAFKQFREQPQQQQPVYQDNTGFIPPNSNGYPVQQQYAPPPRVGRSGASEMSTDIYAHAESMSPSDIEQLFNKFGNR